MVSKRVGIAIAGGALSLALLAGAIIFVARARASRPTYRHSAYADREVLVPGMGYLLPDVEAELREPRYMFFVDPAYPLDMRLVEPLLRDRWELAREIAAERAHELIERALFEGVPRPTSAGDPTRTQTGARIEDRNEP